MPDSTKVRVELQYTINLGNYENLRINIGVEDFVRPGETIDVATDRVYAYVEGKLGSKIREEKAALENRK